MCRRGAALLVLGLLAGARALRAQGGGDAGALMRARLARADSLLAMVLRQDSLRDAEVRLRRRAHVVTAGDLSVVFWQAVATDLGRVLVADAGAQLDEFGAVPRPFISSSVVVQMRSSDTAEMMRATAYRGRRRIELDWATTEDTTSAAWRIAARVAEAYRLTLDGDWREFLPRDYGLGWNSVHGADGALRALAEAEAVSGKECLAGRIPECRLWLGLDRFEHPHAARYRSEELRHMIAERYAWIPADPDRRACVEGSDAACVRSAEGRWFVEAIPAPEVARTSVIRAVHALHGAQAVQRALADTTGSVGLRLARAAGVSEDSLAAEWRVWALSRGRPQRVRAGLGDAMPVVATLVLLLFAAARSGRWP